MDDRESAVRQRAHAIWLAEGEPQGRDEAHWQQAERELAGADGASADPPAEAMSNEGAVVAKPRKKAAKPPKGG